MDPTGDWDVLQRIGSRRGVGPEIARKGGPRPRTSEEIMPFSHNAIEWPAGFAHLIEDVSLTPGSHGKPCSRIDVDVDAATLQMLNEFEVRARHRQVRLRPSGLTECLVGEMNTIVGLGPARDPTRHVGRVRISFHDLQGDDCVDPAAERRRAAM